MSGGHHDCGSHTPAVYSVTQNMDEMEFERGVWNFALQGELCKVQDFLRKGGDPNVKDSSGYTALHYAAREGNADICKVLLDAGAQVNAQTPSGGVTPLQRACYKGHTNVVHLLLERKADVALADSDGTTPLHKAAERGHITIIKVLLSHNKTNLDLRTLKDRTGRTPLDLIGPGNEELSKVLS